MSLLLTNKVLQSWNSINEKQNKKTGRIGALIPFRRNGAFTVYHTLSSMLAPIIIIKT
jgi:hypothetical protein